MALKKMLVSWFGHADLMAMVEDLNDEKLRTRVQELPKKIPPRDRKGDGPIKTLISQCNFDEIHILSQWPEDLNQRFASWINQSPQFHFVEESRLPDPTDYRRVYEVSKSVLETIRKELWELSIFLTPGTPTMAAVWVLLGKALASLVDLCGFC